MKTLILTLLLALSLPAHADIRLSANPADPDFDKTLNIPAECRVYVNGVLVPTNPVIVTVTANDVGDGAVYSMKMPAEWDDVLMTVKTTVRIGKVEVWRRVKPTPNPAVPAP